MLTKVGHTNPMLICTDCGLPMDQRQSIAMARQRLWGALTLVSMALVSGAMLLLASSYEWRTVERESGRQQEGAAGDGAQAEEKRSLFAPSTLIQPSGMGKAVDGGRAGERARPGDALIPEERSGPAVSSKPNAASTKEQHKQQHADPQEQ